MGATAAVMFAAGRGVSSAEGPLAPPGGSEWHALEFPRIPRHTSYTRITLDARDAVRAESDCAASAVYLPLTEVDLAATPRLSWEWKIEQGLHVADERAKSGDDFAARVYVMFRYAPQRATLWQRLQHVLASRLYGLETPGSSINYVWTSTQPVGARWSNPYADAAKMIALGSGPLTGWRREDVDVAADYRAFFNTEPPPLAGIAFMSDSDNTCQRAVAYVANFRFHVPETSNTTTDHLLGVTRSAR